MRIEALRMVLYPLAYVSDHFKTLEICEKAVEDDPWQLKYAPDHLKIQEICNGAVRDDPSSLRYVPDWFVTRERVCMWYDNSEYCDDDDDDDDDADFLKWYNGYKKRKAQKASI